MISIIAAVSDNWAIGRSGDMPWHLSEDLKFFKRTTLGHTVVMGRRTWESLGCKALKDRLNIVISRTAVVEGQDNAVAVATLEEALELASKDSRDDEIFIIGGGQVYNKVIDFADRLYITHVHAEISDADTFFPKFDGTLWEEISRSETFVDEKTGFRYEFVTYNRKK